MQIQIHYNIHGESGFEVNNFENKSDVFAYILAIVDPFFHMWD
jgi:hypothetical protein